MALNDLLKDLTARAQDAASAHKDQIHEAVAKAEAAAQERTGGQYHQQIANAGAKVNEYVARLPDPPAASPPFADEPAAAPAESPPAAGEPPRGPAASPPAAGEPPRDPTEPPPAADGSAGGAGASV